MIKSIPLVGTARIQYNPCAQSFRPPRPEMTFLANVVILAMQLPHILPVAHCPRCGLSQSPVLGHLLPCNAVESQRGRRSPCGVALEACHTEEAQSGEATKKKKKKKKAQPLVLLLAAAVAAGAAYVRHPWVRRWFCLLRTCCRVEEGTGEPPVALGAQLCLEAEREREGRGEMPISSVSKMAQNNLLNSKTPASEVMVSPPHRTAPHRPVAIDTTRHGTAQSVWLSCSRTRSSLRSFAVLCCAVLTVKACISWVRAVCVRAVGAGAAGWQQLHPEGGGGEDEAVETQRLSPG